MAANSQSNSEEHTRITGQKGEKGELVFNRFLLVKVFLHI